MKRCTEMDQEGKTICPACGKEKRPGLNRMCGKQPSLDLTCQHRGPELRREQCPSCSGFVQVKVFQCSLHNECTMSKQIDNLKTCNTCPDKVN